MSIYFSVWKASKTAAARVRTSSIKMRRSSKKGVLLKIIGDAYYYGHTHAGVIMEEGKVENQKNTYLEFSALAASQDWQ